MRSFLFSLPLSLSLAATGCVADEADGGDSEAAEPDDPTLASTTSALCSAGTTPPAPDWTHYFATDPDQIRSISNYGTTSCANYVVRIVNGVSPTYEQGEISAYLTGTVPTTAESCVGTSLTGRRWQPPTVNTGWVATTVTTYGEWTATGCNFPRAYNNDSYWSSGVRYELSAMRSYCPSGGPWCVLQYGLPIKIKVTD
jgi:hypothetical protein